MTYRLLFIFVEGNDDERFFERIIKPELEKKYTTVRFYKYGEVPYKKRSNFLRSIKAMGADYIYVRDINDLPCVTATKQDEKDNLGNIDEAKIMVVIKEIESWYLAGLTDQNAQRFKITPFKNTDNVTKEQFNKLIPQKFARIDFMIEVLNGFSLEIAKQKNRSIKYFTERYN